MVQAIEQVNSILSELIKADLLESNESHSGQEFEDLLEE